MNRVEVIEAGRRVRVGPASVGASDVLEMAEALIETRGWRQGPRKIDTLSHLDVDNSEGFSLHDAIGYACERLSLKSSGTPAKDWKVPDRTGASENLRVAATDAVVAAIGAKTGKALSDIEYNDQSSEGDVLDVLRRARGEDVGGKNAVH